MSGQYTMDYTLQLVELVKAHPILTCIALLVTVLVLQYSFGGVTIPESIPWIYKPSGLFPGLRAGISGIINARALHEDGYEKYSKQNKTYIYPEFGGRPDPVIPHQKLSWLLNKPDSVVSVARAHEDLLYGQYNFTDPHLTQSMFHEHVIHRELVRNLASIIPNAWEELQNAVDVTWGTDTTNWKDFNIWEDGMKIIARVSNRMFVGLPLCRNETYLKNVGYFASDVIMLMTLMSFAPTILAPIVGRLLSIPHWIHFRRIKQLTLPVIKARLLALSQGDAKSSDVPNDYITWHIKTAAAENDVPSLQAERIASSLMPLNFAALHTTTMTITSLMFDIFSSDPSVASILREEAELVYASNNNTWDKQSLTRLVRMDSAIRESMRLNTIGARVMIRKVIADEGLTNEEEGWTVPKGTYVTVDAWSPMHDPDVYAKPDVYDPFRFSRPREQLEKELAEKVEAIATTGENRDRDEKQAELLKLKNTGLITTSDKFLPFGHGRHACPGRFFVSHELKMLLAYVLTHYDVEPIAQRPPNMWIGGSIVPPTKGTIKMRRKAGT